MPDPQEPAWNDSQTDLWRKASQNFESIAIGVGYAGPIETNALDTDTSAMRKSVWFTAAIGEST